MVQEIGGVLDLVQNDRGWVVVEKAARIGECARPHVGRFERHEPMRAPELVAQERDLARLSCAGHQHGRKRPHRAADRSPQGPA
jgi:hypothetical protein